MTKATFPFLSVVCWVALTICVAGEDAATFFQQGSDAYDKGDNDTAITRFNQALLLDPKRTTGYVSRGFAYHNKRQYDRAIADFSQALQLDPQNVTIYIYRGISYDKSGDHEKAIADFNRVIPVDSKNSQPYSCRAHAYDNEGHYDLAIADYGKALEIEPGQRQCYYERGVDYDKVGDKEKAMADFRKILSRAEAGMIFSYYEEAGNDFLTSQDYARAVERFTKLVQLYPDDADCYMLRAYAYDAMDEYDKAIADYSQIIQHHLKKLVLGRIESNELHPTKAEVYAARGSVYEKKRDYNKAIADYSKVIELKPATLVSEWINRGRVFALKGDTNKAIADFTSAIEVDPTVAEAYNRRSSLYRLQGEIAKADADDFRALPLNRRDAQVCCSLGRSNAKEGKYKNALAQFSYAIQVYPTGADAYNGLAWLQATCPQAVFRDGGKAVENATKAAELLEWKDAASINTLAAACAEDGDFDNAVKWQKQYLDTSKPVGKELVAAKSRLALYEAHQAYQETR